MEFPRQTCALLHMAIKLLNLEKLKLETMGALEDIVPGKLYDANYDPEILNLRKEAKIKLYEYNDSSPCEEEKREQFLRKFLGSCGKNPVIEPPFYCDYGNNIHIGNNFYSNHNFVVLDGAKVHIGDNVFIAPNVGLHTAGHPIDAERRIQGLEYAIPITIGDNVWIGAGVSVIAGVSIGKGSVIAAGSVVIRDIPESVVAAGNPCKVIRKITKSDGETTDFRK